MPNTDCGDNAYRVYRPPTVTIADIPVTAGRFQAQFHNRV